MDARIFIRKSTGEGFFSRTSSHRVQKVYIYVQYKGGICRPSVTLGLT